MQIIQASTYLVDIIRENFPKTTRVHPIRDAKSTAQKISMVMRQLEKVCTAASSDVHSEKSLLSRTLSHAVARVSSLQVFWCNESALERP